MKKKKTKERTEPVSAKANDDLDAFKKHIRSLRGSLKDSKIMDVLMEERKKEREL